MVQGHEHRAGFGGGKGTGRGRRRGGDGRGERPLSRGAPPQEHSTALNAVVPGVRHLIFILKHLWMERHLRAIHRAL